MAYLYRHIRLDTNEPFYIGIGSDEDYKYERAYCLDNRNKYWRNIVKSSGYEVEIMLDGLTWVEVCSKEVEIIKLYGRKDKGLGPLSNMTDGGEGVPGMRHTDETKLKISLDNKRPEKMLICMANYAKMITPEAKIKAAANRDYSFNSDPKVIAKRVANTDHKAIGVKVSKVVEQYTMDGVFIKEWPSVSSVRNELGYNLGHIASCCRGTYKPGSFGGFKWKYKIKNVKQIK